MPLALICLEIILNLICVGTAVNGFLLVLLFTSPLWVLLFVCWWPMLLIIVILLKFSSLRIYVGRVTTQFVQYLLYKYNGRQRKTFWNVLYSLLSLGLPNNIVAQNCGFALVSATGESL